MGQGNRALLAFAIITTFAHQACEPKTNRARTESLLKRGNETPSGDDANVNLDVHDNCRFLRDAFEPAARFPADTPKGKAKLCIDTRTARPVVQLTSETASKFDDPEGPRIYLANVTHKDQFYLAAVPNGDEDVERVIFQEEEFPAVVPAAHVQIRLDFRRPVLLVPQINGAGSPHATKHLTLSMEALGEPGWQFDVAKGLQDQFVGVWRVKTLEDFTIHMSKQNPKHKVQQYLLNLDASPKQRAAVLREWIRRSTENKLTRMYNTLTSSCAMEAFNVVEVVRSSNVACQLQETEQMDFHEKLLAHMKTTGQQGLLWIDRHVATPMEIYPTFAKKALQIRGLLKETLPQLDQDPLYKELIK